MLMRCIISNDDDDDNDDDMAGDGETSEKRETGQIGVCKYKLD